MSTWSLQSNRFDAITSWLVLGPIVPVSCTLAAWWSTYLTDQSEYVIARATFLTAGASLIITAIVLDRWAGSLWRMGSVALGCVALFYSVLLYGATMGSLVLNPLVALVGGIIHGRRVRLGGSVPSLARDARRWPTFAVLALLPLALCSAWLALREPSFASELQHMFRLPFDVPSTAVPRLLVLGGVWLLGVQYLLARLGVHFGSRRCTPK